MKAISILIVSTILLILSGCKKEEETGILRGDIVGFVKLVDEFNNELEDKSGVMISIESNGKSVKTNEIGKFVFKDVSAGRLFLTFSKDGYKSFSMYYLFVGGKEPALVPTTILHK